jgi:tetratricopeptide (TPR) repeat protein
VLRYCLIIIAILWLFAAFGFDGVTLPAFAKDPDKSWVCKVISLQGHVVVERQGEIGWQPVNLNDTLFDGDRIRVKANSRAGIVLSNDATLRLDQNTTLVFTKIEKETTFIFKLLNGAVNFFSHRPRSLKFLTPFVNGAVEGTEFYVQVEENQTHVDLFEGRIRAENSFGELLLVKGEGILARAGSPLQRRIPARPRDSVQWALYYPPVLTLGPHDAPVELQKSLTLFEQGRTVAALDDLEEVEEVARDSNFYTYRAALRLHVGRVFQAQDDIQKSLRLDPNNGAAPALKAIIAVVQNQKKEAMQAAQKAVRYAPSSAAAQLALSYAQQALFKLPAALKAAQAATIAAPENGTAWARLAELYLSMGELDHAVPAARKAVKFNPNTAHAYTILGFAFLTQIETEMAKEAFEKAITLDSADPLPRLGLGLAKIRTGDLEQGRSEIEIAAGLDPVNALIRSYLGKAYFDEKREPLDEKQFEIAESLDPNDPTPWFYDAVRKQTLNRPVEALHDLSKSIELNDNRAVYRSRFRLDDDLAARSVSLGRIYNDLGFQQLALVEGWKSVNADPSNYSAHRFLSDSYAALPRHEVARTSELLQSQLLQPINITPVQPQLSENNLLLLEGSGPSEPSLNEFNPLFYRNRNTLLASGVMGENGLWGNELIFSGLWQKVSYSMGQYHYETDGFRQNNDLNHGIYNFFLQTSLSPKISIMAEGWSSEREEGDLPLRFSFNGRDNFSLNRRKERDERTIRAGLRLAFSPQSQIISQTTYVKAEESDHDLFGEYPYDASVDDSGYMVEAQHLLNGKRFNLTGGIGYFSRDREENVRSFGDKEITEPEVAHTNFYAYSHIFFPRHFTWTIGASADFYEDDQTKDRDQFNPKFGVLLTPFSGTTLRAAIFRTLKRSLAGRQTIEPTQVAGFNQFFDDTNGAESWRYGLAIDQTISSIIHGGVEYSTRDIVIAQRDIRTNESEDCDWDESLLRAYLYWTPNDLIALSGEYLLEEFHREDGFPGEENISELKTHRIPLGISFFHPGGLTTLFKWTYVEQEGIFGTNPTDFQHGEDHFWLVDIAIRYRFLNRLGFITIGAQNLFDNDFNFQDMDLADQTIFPERTLYGKVTLSF